MLHKDHADLGSALRILARGMHGDDHLQGLKFLGVQRREVALCDAAEAWDGERARKGLGEGDGQLRGKVRFD